MKHELSSMGLRSLRLEHVKPEPVSIGKSTEAIELSDFYYSYNGGEKQRVAIAASAADSGQNVNGIPSPKRIGGDNRYVFDNRLRDNQPVKRVLMM